MKLLLDTHIFLWYIAADDRLPATIQSQIEDPDNDVYLSAASVWEAVIKSGLGKLPLPEAPAEYLPKQRERHAIQTLPIDEGAFVELAQLPLLHRDPFDRILLAQALQFDLLLVTADAAIQPYPVKLLFVGAATHT